MGVYTPEYTNNVMCSSSQTFKFIIIFFSLFTASVQIIPIERIVSRSDIECPGDIIPYNCSIQSNSETVHLTWRVILPGQMPINITLYPNVTIDGVNFNSYIAASITGFRSDEFIHSTLEVTVQPDISTDQIMLECSIEDLGNDSVTVLINTSRE